MILGRDGTDLLDRPVRETSLDDLTQLFLGAAKPDTQWFVGAEIELLPYDLSSSLPADHGRLALVLETLGQLKNMEREYEPNGALVGLKGHGQLVSLEPGGQLEFASTPHRSLKKLEREIVEHAQFLRQAGDAHGVGFWSLGLQPFVDRHSSPKMPKPRYERMRDYLGQAGTRGLDMMHLTGSVQTTVDFRSEQNLVDKMRTGVRASPFLAALVAASPFSAGKPNGFKTYRYWIWLDTDETRCGIWPEMLDAEGLHPKRYLQKTLLAPPMFFIRNDEYRSAEMKPFGHYVEHGFEGTPVTVKDLLDHLTTFFPEIRPKGYLEFRAQDCVNPKLAVGIAGFWRGILDDEPTRQAVEERLSAMDFEALRKLQPEVAIHGLEAQSAAGPVAEVAEWLVNAAYQRLKSGAPDCAACVLPLLEQAQSRRSPADELLERAEKTSILEALERVRI